MTSVAKDTAKDPSGDEPNLRRHVGVVGLLFASVGSIIGSGWLFGALNASTSTRRSRPGRRPSSPGPWAGC